MTLLQDFIITYYLIGGILAYSEHNNTMNTSILELNPSDTTDGLIFTQTTGIVEKFSNNWITEASSNTNFERAFFPRRKENPVSTFQVPETSAPGSTRIFSTRMKMSSAETGKHVSVALLSPSTLINSKFSDSTVLPKFQSSEKTVTSYPAIFIELTLINQTDAKFCEWKASELLGIFNSVARSKLLSRQSLETVFLNGAKICGPGAESITSISQISVDICIKTKGNYDDLLTVIVWDNIEKKPSLLGKFKNVVINIKIHGLESPSSNNNEKEPHYIGWLTGLVLSMSFVFGYLLTLLIRYLVKIRRHKNKDASSLDTATGFEYQIENNFAENFQQDGKTQSVWM